jgi:FSR family fosmidomycin resistance protein-like MFS transporter
MTSNNPSLNAAPGFAAAPPPASAAQGFVLRIVGAAAFAHLLNDLIQAVLPAVYPMLKTQF